MWVSEIRSIDGDNQLLSMSSGSERFIALHFTWKADNPDLIQNIVNSIHTVLKPIKGRPHWGKLLPSPYEFNA